MPLVQLSGEAQGTTYHINYYAAEGADHQKEMDSLLQSVDQSLSTYVPTSLISRINRNDRMAVADAHFNTVFNKSREVWQLTGGAFDVTVAPVINAWGFGFTKKESMDSTRVDSMLRYVGMDKICKQGDLILKDNPRVMLDFNAIAQGYTVDLLAQLLEQKGITNFMVELGGEVKAQGKKADGSEWKIGIDRPEENAEGRPLEAVVMLENKGLATSGNYRKFYSENGRKFAHIIDPHTGYPAKHNLLSATVVAPDCMTADAYATAFMVMGLEKTKAFLQEHPELNLQVLLVYDDKGKFGIYASKDLDWEPVKEK